MTPALRVCWIDDAAVFHGTVISIAPPTEHTRGEFVFLILCDNGEIVERGAVRCRSKSVAGDLPEEDEDNRALAQEFGAVWDEEYQEFTRNGMWAARRDGHGWKIWGTVDTFSSARAALVAWRNL